MPPQIYYIRKNDTTQLPTNVLFLDVETKPEAFGPIERHRMFMGWTWRVTLDARSEPVRDSWRFFTESGELADYVTGEARNKAPLYVVGSNITFDLFASGLAEHLHISGWKAHMLYDKGLVTVIILKLGQRTLKFLAMQNFLQGGVEQWGALVGLEKKEVDFSADSFDTIKLYCRNDVAITGKVFMDYLRFVRDMDMGGFAVTSSAQSFRAFRHRFMKHKLLHYDQYAYNQFVRLSYAGGRVECGCVGELTDGPYVKLDINSMYPAVMRDNLYPTRIRQWICDPNPTYARKQIAERCCIAEVDIDTDQPVYALRRDGKLLFPIGRFTTHLCTAALRHAQENGHILRVKQLMTFDAARIFTDFVDHFYRLRVRYKREGNAVYEQSVKRILNSLYGKFAEQRELEIVKVDDEERRFFRQPVLVPLAQVEPEPRLFDARYKPEPRHETKQVPGIEWSAFGVYSLTAGNKEGPMSHPAIAAHVTDYGRMLLWRYIEAVGRENVLYCDTDSLILHNSQVHKLKNAIDDDRLGALKVEDRAERIDLRGAKDYTFSHELRRKGIRKNAEKVGHNQFSQQHFPGLYSLIRNGDIDAFPIVTITKTLTGNYNKGVVSDDGLVSPHRLSEV